jgi:hypothetical protein
MAKRTGIIKNCLFCSRPFYVPKGKIERSFYCSLSCKLADKKPFCVHGHEIAVVGRDKHGSCNQCKIDRVASYIPPSKEGKIYPQFCKYGHDTSICGRNKAGRCRDCQNQAKKAFYKAHADDWHQYYLDNIDAIKAYQRRHLEENRVEILEKKREYQRECYEILEIKKIQYNKEHPEVRRGIALRSNKKRGLRVVPWGQEGMHEFYINMPDGMTEDHIIPLCGKKISGLHVSWNLQYLSPDDNRKKKNKCNLIEASEWYGKILEEAGLK